MHMRLCPAMRESYHYIFELVYSCFRFGVHISGMGMGTDDWSCQQSLDDAQEQQSLP